MTSPSADGDGGDSVDDEAGQSAAFTHEAVGADEQGEQLDWDARHGGQSGERDNGGGQQ